MYHKNSTYEIFRDQNNKKNMKKKIYISPPLDKQKSKTSKIY